MECNSKLDPTTTSFLKVRTSPVFYAWFCSFINDKTKRESKNGFVLFMRISDPQVDLYLSSLYGFYSDGWRRRDATADSGTSHQFKIEYLSIQLIYTGDNCAVYKWNVCLYSPANWQKRLSTSFKAWDTVSHLRGVLLLRNITKNGCNWGFYFNHKY